jgi:cytochrome c553
MNGIQYALRRIHDGEKEITKDLLELADRHRMENEIHHVARDLALWSQEHMVLLAREANRLELDLDENAKTPSTIGRRLRKAAATSIGRRHEPGLLLLDDLCRLYLRAAESSLNWELLAQIAQSQRQQPILDICTRCHPQTLRQVRWANTMLKTQSPQILASL